MLIPKRDILALLDRMPEQFYLEELHYQLNMLCEIKKGLKDAEEGRVVSHDEVKARWEAKLAAIAQKTQK